jgi:hypothetical protein
MKPIKTLLCSLLLLVATQAISQIPSFNSNPVATATIYLDFDGEYVTGTSWNWGGPINAQPPALSIAAITEIFQRVAEDYRIFNINITTDSTVFYAAPINRRTRVIVTSSSSWYGNAGGVAYVGSFSWGDGTPAWVFSNLLGNNVKYVSEACAHEAGHTFGLQHQSQYNTSCAKTAEYYAGQGSGEIGWAPIMGVGYYRNLTTWHNGANSTGCYQFQSDIDIIAGPENGFGLRSDDNADSYTAATDINVSGLNFTVTGLVNNATDKDVFRIFLPSDQNFKLTAVPQNVGAGNAGADMDIQVSLLDGNADTIGRYNPSLLLNAGIDTNLARGTYYLVTEGTGNANLGDYGSVGYYSLTGALNRVLPMQRFNLSGSNANGTHSLNWTYMTNEVISQFEVQSSQDGVRFEKLLTLQPSEHSMAYKPGFAGNIFYRVKAITPDERSYYSNVIALLPLNGKPVQVMNTLVRKTLNINCTGQYDYRVLQTNGQLVKAGKLQAGYNSIGIETSVKGVLYLRIFNANEHWTERLVRQ